MPSSESSNPAVGQPIIDLRGIVKRYPGVVALGGVSFSIWPGEVVALIGENGAGKSTLMKVLGGVVKPDEGEIIVEGKSVHIDSVRKSAELGIGLIHQELNPLDNLDVAGNVFLAREPTRFGMIDQAKMRRDTDVLLQRLGLAVSADTSVKRLSLAQRQMVEIAKALSQNARVLIMDEPTSSLTLTETETLLGVVRDLKAQGVAIVYISHRLGEVKQIADRVVALRDGQNAGSLTKEEISHDSMVKLMVGRDLERTAYSASGSSGEPRLSIRKLRTDRFPEKEVSFDVLPGEIFCLAGLVGAGRSEVVQAIFGVDPAIGGTILLDGIEIQTGSPQSTIAAGIGLVPEDRRGTGLIVEWSIRENIVLPSLHDFATAGLVRSKDEAAATQREANEIAVKAPTVESTAATLSGGNQQKVVLAKWLLRKPKLLILDEPTRGVDVRAKAEIYQIIRTLAKNGVAILMVSSDMEEVIGVSDRVGVMAEGSLTGVLPRTRCTEEEIMRLAVPRGNS